MLFSGPISTNTQVFLAVSLYKFIIIVHLMTLKSEVAELRYKVAELSSGELRLTFTTEGHKLDVKEWSKSDTEFVQTCC